MEILRSVVSPTSLADFVSKSYAIGSIVSHKLLKACGSNDIYLLQTKNQAYVAKLFSKRLCWQFTKPHFLYELEMQYFLKNQDVPVSAPLFNLRQELVTEFPAPEYKKYLCMYPFISCNQEKKTRYQKYFLLGQTLAKFHKEGKKFKPNSTIKRVLDINFLVQAPLKRLHKYANIYSGELYKELDIVAEALQNALDAIMYSDFSESIIHGDVHCGNFVFSNNKAILIDFELSGYGKTIYDLATLYWDTILFKKPQVAKSIWSHFLKGYLTIGLLPQDEMKSIRLIAQVRHFFMMGSSYILYPELAKFNTEVRIKKDLCYIDKLKKSAIDQRTFCIE